MINNVSCDVRWFHTLILCNTRGMRLHVASDSALAQSKKARKLSPVRSLCVQAQLMVASAPTVSGKVSSNMWMVVGFPQTLSGFLTSQSWPPSHK